MKHSGYPHGEIGSDVISEKSLGLFERQTILVLFCFTFPSRLSQFPHFSFPSLNENQIGTSHYHRSQFPFQTGNFQTYEIGVQPGSKVENSMLSKDRQSTFTQNIVVSCYSDYSFKRADAKLLVNSLSNSLIKE